MNVSDESASFLGVPWFGKKTAGDDEVEKLRRRLDDAESTIRTLKQEWLDTLERLDRILGRIVKRRERLSPVEDADEPQRPRTIAQLRAQGKMPW